MELTLLGHNRTATTTGLRSPRPSGSRVDARPAPARSAVSRRLSRCAAIMSRRPFQFVAAEPASSDHRFLPAPSHRSCSRRAGRRLGGRLRSRSAALVRAVARPRVDAAVECRLRLVAGRQRSNHSADGLRASLSSGRSRPGSRSIIPARRRAGRSWTAADLREANEATGFVAFRFVEVAAAIVGLAIAVHARLASSPSSEFHGPAARHSRANRPGALLVFMRPSRRDLVMVAGALGVFGGARACSTSSLRSRGFRLSPPWRRTDSSSLMRRSTTWVSSPRSSPRLCRWSSWLGGSPVDFRAEVGFLAVAARRYRLPGSFCRFPRAPG